MTAAGKKILQSLARVRRTGNPDRSPDDWYVTMPKTTRALLQKEQFSLNVWEPSCGDGRMSRVLEDAGYNVISTDLVDRGYGISGIDFLRADWLAAPSIITNPPFDIIDDYVLHAIELGVEKMAIFARTAWLEGGKRYDILWSRFPPVRIWQFSLRQTLWRGDDPAPKEVGGAIAFAWFVFEKNYKGNPEIRWIR